jgi:uncharacterized protein YbaP (TraB family)
LTAPSPGARILAAIAAALCLAATTVWARPPVWVAKRGGATMFLFGSIHLLPPGLDWRPQALIDALAKADTIIFELPIDMGADAEAVRLARTLGSWPAADSLSAHLTDIERKRLARVARLLGASPEALDRLRPWLAEVTLSLMDDTRNGAAATQGVEQQIQQMAPATARRDAFETVHQQIGFLAGAPLADQVASLDETLREIEEEPDSYRRTVTEWMSGDVTALQTDALSPLLRASPVIYRRLIADRNARWAADLRRRLSRPGLTVVIVGMGHLVGPGGVPALLRARGVKVEGP